MRKDVTLSVKTIESATRRGIRKVFLFNDEGLPLDSSADLRLTAGSAVIVNTAGRIAELLGKNLASVEIRLDDGTRLILEPALGDKIRGMLVEN